LSSTTLFLQKNYLVFEAIHGRSTLYKLNLEQDFNLIIINLNLPGINGLKFIKIQSKNDDIKNRSTIMCTTDASRGHERSGKKRILKI
jgi:CheY-like chemotaxis protein